MVPAHCSTMSRQKGVNGVKFDKGKGVSIFEMWTKLVMGRTRLDNYRNYHS